MYNQQRVDDLRIIAKAIDLDLENISKSVLLFYNTYKNNSFPQNIPFVTNEPFYDIKNGLYHVFDRDIAKLDYNLSADIYKFYIDLSIADEYRQIAFNFWKNNDIYPHVIIDVNGTAVHEERNVEIPYNAMKNRLIDCYERIPRLRKRLKSIYERQSIWDSSLCPASITDGT